MDVHFIMPVMCGFRFQARWRGAAEVRRTAGDFVAERLAGERVVGQRNGDLGQPRGQRAVVRGGVEPQGFDVPQERDPLVQPPSLPVDGPTGSQQFMDGSPSRTDVV